MYRLWTPSLPGVWRPQVHGPCAHNLVRGLLQRTFKVTPSPSQEGLDEFRREVGLIKRVLRGRVEALTPWTLERTVESYTVPRLRARYERALESLLADGLCTRQDSSVKAFVKGEKLTNYKLHKPRVIMGRDPRYNLELASYLKPLEHALYPALRGFGRQYFTRTRLIGKGLNPQQRAKLISRKMSAEPDVVAMEIDGVSFESHFSKPILRAEHSVYNSLHRNKRLAQLLDWQLSFDAVGEGVRYHAEGIRASGDFNTGLGNTIVMCALVMMVARVVGKRYDFLADGDNALLFVKKQDVDLWRSTITSVSLRAGFEMALEPPVEHLAEVVFGQSRPFMGPDGLTMVRNPFKVISHAATGYQHYGELRGAGRVLKSVAYCEAVLSRGVPVLSSFAAALLKATRNFSFSSAELEDFEYRRILSKGVRWEEAVTVPITDEARLWFNKSWGVSVEAQLLWESILEKGFDLPTSWNASNLLSELPDGRDLDTLPFDVLGDFS